MSSSQASIATARQVRDGVRIDDDVVAGLLAPTKRLPCKLLYDARGAELFERICELEAYYPTRTEIELLADHAPVIAAIVGPGVRVIEPGSGEGLKTRLLLRALDVPAAYVPIDVSREQLHRTATCLRRELPGLDVHPIAGDYTQAIVLPAVQRTWQRTLVFFPGSTIGNFEPEDARDFLARLAGVAGRGALLLLGADATRDPEVLVRAYDDEHGVTAAFNRNILAHVNRTHGATFELDAFAHRAVWNSARSRIEMHLVSARRQVVAVAGVEIPFAPGESIVTEHCYKRSPEELAALVGAAGWRVRRVFTASPRPMQLWLCET